MITHEKHLRRIAVLWWLFVLRWVVASAVILFLYVSAHGEGYTLQYPLALMIGLPLFFYGFNSIAIYWLRPSNRVHVHEKGLRIISNTVIPVDLLLTALLFVVSGGIVGWGRLFFLLIPIFSIILFEHTHQVAIWGVVSISVVSILALLESIDVLPIVMTRAQEVYAANQDMVFRDVVSYFLSLVAIVVTGALAARDFHESDEIAGREFSMFTRALENLPDVVILWSADRGVTFMNKKAEALFHISRDMVLDRPLSQLIDPQTARLRSALLLQVSEEESGGVRFSVPNGEHTRTFMVSNVPLHLRKGYGSELRILREVTHEEAVSQVKSKFMSVAAHQLRTPISGLKWLIQMILAGEAGPVTDMQREFLGRGAETTERMIRLVGDLLDVTRIEEGRFAYDFEVYADLSSFVENIVNQFKARAHERGIALTFKVSDEQLPPLLIDPTRLAIAVENIVSNAFKYTMKGSITTTIERRDRDVAIVVADTGVGVPAEELSGLFSKFHRGRNVVERGIEGTGLGLFISKAILLRHGGNISVTSEENKGATFVLTLPIDPSRVPAGDVPIEEAVV